jgi:hypothetical protein
LPVVVAVVGLQMMVEALVGQPGEEILLLVDLDIEVVGFEVLLGLVDRG